jgi:hypothetical protein
MALAKCRECGTEVSDAAKTCPKCGISKPVKKSITLVTPILAIAGLALVGAAFSVYKGIATSGPTQPALVAVSETASKPPAPTTVESPEDKATHRAYRLFEFAKASLKDPDAAKFKNLTTDATGALLCGEVNAKNSYGAYIGNETFAYAPGGARVNQSDVNRKAWNKKGSDLTIYERTAAMAHAIEAVLSETDMSAGFIGDSDVANELCYGDKPKYPQTIKLKSM